MAQDAWLIVGLGNPGPGYAANRHNVGQMVVDELARRSSARFGRHRSNAQLAETRIGPGEPTLLLAKPSSFMNVSGGPVANLAKYFSIPPERIVVVHDELDIPFDALRLKRGGGHGGHNGVRDIASALGTADFVRVRVGIGRPPGRQSAADFVLHDFSSTEKKTLDNQLADAADAIEQLVRDGLTAAQQRVHAPS